MGKIMFQTLKDAVGNENLVGLTQAIVLIFITVGTLIYTLCKKHIRTKQYTQVWLCIVIGILLGIMSSFLGIGGGPVSYTHLDVYKRQQYTRILINDIVFTDYHNHYIQVHTTSNVVRSYMSFDAFSPMLKPYPQFLWCYRNCMVNMDYIESLEGGDFLLKTGVCIPISKGKHQEVTQAYANYMFDYVNRRCPI